MGLVTLNLKPSKQQLRSFGLIGLMMCSVIGVLLFMLAKIPVPGLVLFFGAGGVLFILSRISLTLIKPVYLTLIVITFPIGWCISQLVMMVFYYGVITPIAVIFRLSKRDLLSRKYDSEANTYWIRYTRKRTAKDYFRQF